MSIDTSPFPKDNPVHSRITSSPPPSLHSVMCLFVSVKRGLCVPINTPGRRGTPRGTCLKPLLRTHVSRMFETEMNHLPTHCDDFRAGMAEW